MKFNARRSLIALATAVILIQFVPVSRTNPPVTGEIPAPDELKAVLKQSCYDCHSNESKWPWYSHVAPVSWLVVHDVNEARGEMNFSEWDQLTPKAQAHKLKECIEEIEEREMPLRIYLPMHPEARVSDADLATLRAWVASVVPESDDDDHD